MAPLATAKQVRIAPQPASDARSRRDQMLCPLSGMPGLPPGIQTPLGEVVGFCHAPSPWSSARFARATVRRKSGARAVVPLTRPPRAGRNSPIAAGPRAAGPQGAGMGPLQNFWAIVSVPDNIPIVFMLLLVGYFTYLSFDEARKNDSLISEGR